MTLTCAQSRALDWLPDTAWVSPVSTAMASALDALVPRGLVERAEGQTGMSARYRVTDEGLRVRRGEVG